MINRHHLIFNRFEWSARPQSKEIRDTPSLIIPMERSEHEELHRICAPIPNLGHEALLIVMGRFRPVEDTLDTMESLMSAIEAASRHYKCKPIERRLAMLAVEAIDSQIPYIR